MESLHDILDWMAALPPVMAYAAILLIAYGENVVPPIPGDMAVVFGGYLVGVGRLDFLLVVLLATVGGTAGFMTMYAIGYHVGEAVLDPDRLRWLPKKGVGRATRWLERYGLVLVAANRFLSGLRSVISLTVGIARTDLWKTTLFATFSSLVWTALITYAGFAVGDNWQVVAGYLRDYGRIVLAAIVVAVAVQALRWYLKRKGSKPDPNDGGNFNNSNR